MKKIVLLLVCLSFSGSVLAHGNESDEDDPDICIVADFKTFTSVISGDVGENPHPMPCSCMNPKHLTAPSGEIPATATVNEKRIYDNRIVVATRYIDGKCIERERER